jgi:3-phosphoshikimate 1-carboxyvinyltransferase
MSDRSITFSMLLEKARRVVAIRPEAPLSGGEVCVPGDKSISHRALMLGALAIGETRIRGLLEGEDVLRTASAMRALGADVVRAGEGIWHVTGRGIGGLTEPGDVLDMGNSGTAARLLCGILATHDLFAVITGDSSLRGRPMRRVTDPLLDCGAFFASRSGRRLPLAVRGAAEPSPLNYRVPVASAQVKSALLLAGLNAPGITSIEEPVPTRDHTENMLRYFGAHLKVDPVGGGRIILLRGQPELHAAHVDVPGDPSSAAFPLVAALGVPGSFIRIRDVGLNPLRTGLFAALKEMGADLAIQKEHMQGGERVGDVVARHSHLRGLDVPSDRAPAMIDEYPILAVAAAFAEGTTRMRGVGELRVKESDRLTASAAMLQVNGVSVKVEGDDLLIRGTGRPPVGGGLVRTRMDHRIAMSALVLGLISEQPVTIDDCACIETSFPNFLPLMHSLGGRLGSP